MTVKNKKSAKPKKEVKAFINEKTTKKKGETTNKRVNSLNIKTKRM